MKNPLRLVECLDAWIDAEESFSRLRIAIDPCLGTQSFFVRMQPVSGSVSRFDHVATIRGRAIFECAGAVTGAGFADSVLVGPSINAGQPA